MTKRGAALTALLGLALGLTTRAEADQVVTYDLTYSGAPFGNNDVGTGTITIDTSLVGDTAAGVNNTGHTDTSTTPGFVTAFSLTITGASSGDGTFGLADYSGGTFYNSGGIYLDTNGTLNLNEQLIGQPTNGDLFGTPNRFGGDFNLFPNANDPNAPVPVYYFTIALDGGSGDYLQLTSFAPAVNSVPEPATLVGAATAALLGLGYALRRRRHRAA